MLKKSGKPRLYSEQSALVKVTTFRLSFWHLKTIKKYGGGSVSDGVRKAIEAVVSGALTLPPADFKLGGCQSEPLRFVGARLTLEQTLKLREIGSGSTTDGVRRIIEAVAANPVNIKERKVR